MNIVYKPRQELKPKNLQGIGDEQIAQHWKLYEGYVKNVNALGERLAALSEKGEFGLEFAELKRRYGFELDGMILHEQYFGVLRSGEAPPSDASDLAKQVKRCFGGFNNWRREFSAMGAMRGVGWVILYLEPRNRTLTNHWIGLHEQGHPAGFAPVLVMDVWEHAYMVDHGADGRSAYVEAFLKNVGWSRVERKLSAALRQAETVAAEDALAAAGK